ncbi:MAG TPA: DCC1-like thiol-disulfide oxidoreductase family protein [Mycobacteriales bacterium]|jgi:predicted DCC family thiol-disulfide oxidoreductase YuxK
MTPPTLVYDGDCRFCSACARFVNRRIPTPAEVVAWQHADIGVLELTPAECTEAVRWIHGEDRAAGADALARMLVSAGSGWRLLGHVLLSRPVLVVARPVYRLIARNRARRPGRVTSS